MNFLPWIWTHTSLALIFTAASRRKSSTAQAGVLMTAFLAGTIPIGETDLSGQVLPFLGNLSATSVALLLLMIRSHSPTSAHVWRRREEECSIAIWAGIGSLLIASSLGYIAIDMYGVGYDLTTAWITLAASVAAFMIGYSVFAFCLLCSLLAWQVNANGSTNLWDYLLDPWLTICSVILIGRAIALRIMSRHAPTGSPAQSGLSTLK